MKRKVDLIKGCFMFLGMLTVILDSKTAFEGAKSGIQFCLETVIPALLPFLFLSCVINNLFWGKSFKLLYPVTALCKIPKGSESILLLGLLGGYPVGAQLIYQCYTRKQLTYSTAKRMLGFCNNAGPAFIFGMLSHLFTNTFAPLLLWMIQIISAILTGIFLPSDNKIEECSIQEASPLTLSQIIQNIVKIMATISAWIVFFKIILGFVEKWFMRSWGQNIQVLIAGSLELSNGCAMLKLVREENIRFVIAGVLLSAGGLCVGMQVKGVVKELGMGMYFPGKALQVMISYTLSILIQLIVYQNFEKTNTFFIIIISIGIIIVSYILIKKRYSIHELHGV